MREMIYFWYKLEVAVIVKDFNSMHDIFVYKAGEFTSLKKSTFLTSMLLVNFLIQ